MKIVINKLLLLLKNQKPIFSNMGYLFILQIFTYIFPLLTYPIIIKRVGIANFGLIAFSNSIISYFILISDFGFNLTSAKNISINRNEKSVLQKIFVVTLMGKLLITFILLLILLLLIIYIDKIGNESKLFLFSFLIVLGQAIFPVWYLQGIEQMKYITIFQFFSKLLYLFLIMLFLKLPGDYYFVPLFNGISSIIISIISLVYIIRKYRFKFSLPKIQEVLIAYKDSFPVFLGISGTSLYRNINTLLIAFITNNNYLVGVYSLSEKIIFTLQSMITPISQSLFPALSVKFKKITLLQSLAILKKISYLYSIILVIISISIFLFSKIILSFFVQEVDTVMIQTLRIMTLVPFFGGFNYLLGIIGLINLNYKKYFALFVFIAGISSSIISIYLISIFSIRGAAFSVSLAEIILFILILSKLIQLKYTYANKKYIK